MSVFCCTLKYFLLLAVSMYKLILYLLLFAFQVPFEVDPNLGHLKVKRSLDYDNIEHQTFSLELIAVDKGQLQLTG